MRSDRTYSIPEDDGYINAVLNGERKLIDKVPGRHVRDFLRGVRSGFGFPGIAADMYAEVRHDYHPDNDDAVSSIGKMIEGFRKDHYENGAGYGAFPVGDPPAMMDTRDEAYFLGVGAGLLGPAAGFLGTGDPAFLAPYASIGVDAANYVERYGIGGPDE